MLPHILHLADAYPKRDAYSSAHINEQRKIIIKSIMHVVQNK